MTRHISSKWRPKPSLLFTCTNKTKYYWIVSHDVSYQVIFLHVQRDFPFLCSFEHERLVILRWIPILVFLPLNKRLVESSILGVSHQDGNLRSPQWKFFQQACTSFSPRPKMAPIQANKWMNREAGAYSTYEYARPISAHIVPQYQCCW